MTRPGPSVAPQRVTDGPGPAASPPPPRRHFRIRHRFPHAPRAECKQERTRGPAEHVQGEGPEGCFRAGNRDSAFIDRRVLAPFRENLFQEDFPDFCCTNKTSLGSCCLGVWSLELAERLLLFTGFIFILFCPVMCVLSEDSFSSKLSSLNKSLLQQLRKNNTDS